MRTKFNGILTLFLAFIVQLTFAQEKTISGTVTDDKGLPLPGVNIIIKNTTNGTQTDFDGNYSILANRGAVLTFSYVGFDPKEVAIGNSDAINVKLDVSASELEEVIVVAYGTQTKQSITGAIATIQAEEIAEIQTANAVQGLTGKVSGVQIINQSGQPGANPSVRFRGVGSINASSEPLYVVDGVPFNGNVNSIAPQDIESISFLKDASSNALYGSRGANGVILITTKKGKKQGLEITIDTKVGFNTRAVPEYDIITDSGEFYETWYNRWRIGLINRGATPEDAANTAASGLVDGDFGLGYNSYNVVNNQIIDPNTGKINPNASLLYQDNWDDASFGTGVRTENYISVRSTSEKTASLLSFGHLDDEGYAINSGFERLTARASLDYDASDAISLGGNINYAHTSQDSPLQGVETNTISNLFRWSRSIAPIYPIYGRDANGGLVLDKNGNRRFDFGVGKDDFAGTRPAFTASQNPVATNLLDINENVFDNLSGRAYISVDFLKNFNFKYNYSVDLINGSITQFATPIGGNALEVNGRITNRSTRAVTLANQQLLSWDKDFGNHTISILVGHESNNYNFKMLAGQVTETLLPDLPVVDNGTTIQFLTGYQKDYTIEGYLSRINYDYDNKYFLNASYRRDASSVFSPENRWGSFFGIGAAWSLHKENFLNDTDWLNSLRLKASYGEQGNDAVQYEQDQTIIGDIDNRNYYAYLDQFNIVNSGDGTPGVSFFSLGNENLVWETSTNINGGFELSILNNRVNLNAEYFERKVEDLIFYNPLPLSQGVGSKIDNVGDMENKGVEVELSFGIIRSEDFDWNLSINATHYKNEITRLPDEFIDDGLFRLEEGKSRYAYFTREFAGIDPDNGDALWFVGEPDAVGVRQTTEDAAVATEYFTGKDAIPDLYGGFSSSFRYKRLTLNVAFAYQIGGYGYDGVYQNLLGSTSAGDNLHKDVINSWSPENPNSNLPRLDVFENDQNNTSDFFLVDATYLSLQDISIGYDLNVKPLEKLKIKSARIYASASNVNLWSSSRKGYDPRLSVTGNASNEYSLIRTTSMGVTVTF